MIGYSHSGSNTTGDAVPNPGAMFICTERVSAGTFTVPVWILSALPPSRGSISGPMTLIVKGAQEPAFTVWGGPAPSGVLWLGRSPLFASARISPPPSGLDVAFFSYLSQTGQIVDFY